MSRFCVKNGRVPGPRHRHDANLLQVQNGLYMKLASGSGSRLALSDYAYTVELRCSWSVQYSVDLHQGAVKIGLVFWLPGLGLVYMYSTAGGGGGRRGPLDRFVL